MKPIFSLAAGMLLAGTCWAQRGVSLSVKGGPQLSDMHATDLKADKRLGYTAGLGLAYGFTPKLSDLAKVSLRKREV